jgi:hypothetical protein
MNRILKFAFVFFVFELLACNKPATAVHPYQAAESAAVVTLTKHQLFHIHLETAEVKESAVPIPLTLPDKIMLNERRRAEITARLAGRVEKVTAFAGNRVAAGQVLAQIFSQEFLTMQIERLPATTALLPKPFCFRREKNSKLPRLNSRVCAKNRQNCVVQNCKVVL